MQRRRVAVLVTVLVFALVGAACTGSGSSSGTNQGGPVNITLWHGYGNIQTPNCCLDGSVSAFAAVTKSAQVQSAVG